MSEHPPTPDLSIVIPALNEAGNITPLVEQVRDTVVHAGVDTELIIVDDGSTDTTLAELKALQTNTPWLRVLHRPAARGQSAAMFAGIQAARAPHIATLDADLQNDPADLVPMLKRVRAGEADMVQGDRSANRQDNAIRKLTSRIGRLARRVVIGDPVRDTGCSARVVRAEIARQFPLQFKGMHRFFPAYARLLGASIVEMPVHHRPRTIGTTKYGFGILSRGVSGFFDLFTVRWMAKRHRDTSVSEVVADAHQESP